MALVGVLLVQLDPLNHLTSRSIDWKVDAVSVIRMALAAKFPAFSWHLCIEGETEVVQAQPNIVVDLARSGDLGEMSEINTARPPKASPGKSPSPPRVDRDSMERILM